MKSSSCIYDSLCVLVFLTSTIHQVEGRLAAHSIHSSEHRAALHAESPLPPSSQSAPPLPPPAKPPPQAAEAPLKPPLVPPPVERFPTYPTATMDSTLVPSAPNQTILAGTFSTRRWWGFPSYAKDLDVGLRSWPELARSHGHLGQVCTPEQTQQKCGTAFVCKAGVCGECVVSRDCGEKFYCQMGMIDEEGMVHNRCIFRVLIEQWTWAEVLCTVLIILTAMLSAAAGMGGGGVYVPLCLLLLGLSTQEAVPLSQTMIVGGAIVNVLMFCGDRNSKYPNRPRIDYDVVMMLNPGLAAGVTIGVMCNVVSPQWLIVITLIITMVIALEKSLTKGLATWAKESKAIAEAEAAAALTDTTNGNQGGPGVGHGGASSGKGKNVVKLKMADFNGFLELAPTVPRPLALIFGCWAVFLAANLVKAPSCSGMYWLQLVGMLVICGAFTYAGEAVILERQASGGCTACEGVIAWTPFTLRFYPVLSCISGFLGGFLGIGGGIIMGPLLLELGMAAEVSQATTAMFVFLSSSLATIQFMWMGKAMPEFCFWFTTWVILATFIGQVFVDYVLQRYQRSSLIVLSIAGIIAGSLVMMTAIGARDTYTDLNRGADMGFAPARLCS